MRYFRGWTVNIYKCLVISVLYNLCINIQNNKYLKNI